ncbi:MAG: ribokinase [Pseudomonadota bacterium]
MTQENLKLAVVGSINLDMVAHVQAFPRDGETVSDAKLAHHPGGKGGNQALAASRLGAEVHMVACVGDEPNADRALAQLREAGIDLTHVRRLPDENTGVAMILVDETGENQIVVAPGANARFEAHLLEIPEVQGVIAQLEVPMKTLVTLAERHEGFFCLNAAPARPVDAAVLARTDLLVVNELEAEAIGPRLADYRGWLAVTYGAAGAELTREGSWVASSEAPRVETISSVGAGDAFTAALAVSLMEGLEPQRALERACVAGAIATTRHGAQCGPTSDEIDNFMSRSGP